MEALQLYFLILILSLQCIILFEIKYKEIFKEYKTKKKKNKLITDETIDKAYATTINKSKFSEEELNKIWDQMLNTEDHIRAETRYSNDPIPTSKVIIDEEYTDPAREFSNKLNSVDISSTINNFYKD